MNGIFVTGTDTNIGKTWVGQHLITALCKNDNSVVPRKPIESGWQSANIENTDAWLLAKAANKLADLNDICPNRFSHPLSPVRAAMLEDKKLSVATLKNQCLKNISNDSFLFVEGAGGFYSPLCADGLNADLASALSLPILLVAENRLGCINQILLTIEAIEKRGLPLKAIVLNTIINNAENTEMNNLEDLTGMTDYPIITTHHNQTSNTSFETLASLLT